MKNYTAVTAHPHDLVHIPAKFRENTAMRLRKLNMTDRQMDKQKDGQGALQYLPSPGLRREIIKFINGASSQILLIWQMITILQNIKSDLI